MTDRLPTTVTEWLRDAVADRPRTTTATRGAIAEPALLVGVLAVWEYAYAASALHLGTALGGAVTVFHAYAVAFVVGAAALAADARRRGLRGPHPALAGLLGVGLFVAASDRHIDSVSTFRWDAVAAATLSGTGLWTWREDRTRAF